MKRKKERKGKKKRKRERKGKGTNKRNIRGCLNVPPRGGVKNAWVKGAKDALQPTWRNNPNKDMELLSSKPLPNRLGPP